MGRRARTKTAVCANARVPTCTQLRGNSESTPIRERGRCSRDASDFGQLYAILQALPDRTSLPMRTLDSGGLTERTIMNAKYGEDDQRRTDDGLYIQERIKVVPWYLAKKEPSEASFRPRAHNTEGPRLGPPPAYLWFAEGFEVKPTREFERRLQPFWNGYLLTLSLNEWVPLGQPPADCQRPAIILPRIPRWCEVAHTAKGGVFRTLRGSLPIYIRQYKIINKRFYLRDHDQVLSGVFFLSKKPTERLESD